MAPKDRDAPVLVVGAGFGGLAAALRLAAAGVPVTVIDRGAAPGGKARGLAGPTGPIAAGPTVLTLRDVFDGLFATAGARVEDHVRLVPLPVLARHFWADGSQLDLHPDTERNAAAIRSFAGPAAEREFRAFADRARRLFQAFDGPMMRNPAPTMAGMTAVVMRQPRLIPLMAPQATLAGMLKGAFRDPRLAQLFGRYATYVGGAPDEVPALLALVWQAEAAGVWAVEGGMAALAGTMAAQATALGARFLMGTGVRAIRLQDGRVAGVELEDGTRIDAGRIVFNGDPRALALGLLGPDLAAAVPGVAAAGRSHSAAVWAFAARATGTELSYHNVFFAADPQSEFTDLAAGRMPRQPTVYVCAQDRIGGALPATERFEVILNAPPLTRAAQPVEEARCRDLTFPTLARFGLSFDPPPDPAALSLPQDFDRMFPGSAGSIYGSSPRGLTAALQRPMARTAVPGLYLAGGGVHPGPGVPMAALSGIHAATALMADRAST